MPVPYRRYFMDRIVKTLDSQNKEYQKIQQQNKLPTNHKK